MIQKYMAIINPFPELIAYAPYATTILRLVMGLYFIYLGYKNFATYKKELYNFFESIDLPYPLYAVDVLAILEIICGIFLILGFLTQITCIVTILIAVVSLVASIDHKDIGLRSRSTYAFLFAISLTLIFTGAGMFSVDSPL